MAKYNIGAEFDEKFLNAMQFQMQLNQRRDEANQEIQYQIRQLSLLDDYRNRALAQDQAQFESSLGVQKEKLEEDKRQFAETQKYKYDVLGQDQTQFGMKLKIDEARFNKELGLGYARLAEDQRQFGLMQPIKEMEVASKIADRTESRSKDISKIVGDINYGIEENDNNGIIANTEELMELTGLKNDSNMIWQDIKEGYSIEESIKAINEYRKSQKLPEYTKDEINYLKLYFRARIR